MHKSKAIPKLHTNYMHHFCLVSVVLFGTGKVKLVKLYSLVWTHDLDLNLGGVRVTLLIQF
jgi:hypothetical protein